MEKSEIFFKRPGTTDKGKDYENMAIAKIVLQLINDPRIKDFQISSNDQEFGAFDDIVVKLESESGIKVQALQLKHSEKKLLSLENLKSKKGDYSIRKYFESLQDIESSVDELILFTNRSFYVKDDTQFQLEGEEFWIKPVEVDDTLELSNGTKNIYQFQIVNDDKMQNDSRTQEYDTFLGKFYLYADQENLFALKSTTRDEFIKMYSSDDETFEKFFQIIVEWMLQEGKKEKLNKQWIKQIIILQILSPYVEALSVGKVNEKMKILRQCTSMFDVTVFEESSSEKVKQMWGDFDNLDFKELNAVARKYQLAGNHIDDNTVNSMDGRNLAQLLWLTHKCPLILHASSNVENVLQLCPKKNFILLGASAKIKNCSVFRNLANLDKKSDKFEKVMTTFTVSIQGKRELSLMTIFEDNDDFLENVSTDDLLEMLNGPHYIDGGPEMLPELYIERSLSQKVFDLNYLQKRHDNTIIILHCPFGVDKIKEKLSYCQIIDAKKFHKFSLSRTNSEFSSNESSFVNTIYVNEGNIKDSELQEIFNRNAEIKNFHFFTILNDESLAWIYSKGDISSLEEFSTTNTHSIDEKSLWSSRLKNSINLITGDPGMGKSTLMKSFKNNCKSTFWTFIVTSKDCNQYFTNCELPKTSNHTVPFEQFITREKCGLINRLEQKFFELCVVKKNIVLVWDALDEVLKENLEATANLITDFSKKGFLQWVTSRQHLKTHLEQKFSVVSLSMNQFSEQEQDDYIRQRLSSFIPSAEIGTTIKKIKSTFVILEHVNILGIPLQLFMLTELFRRNNNKYLKLLNNSFLLTDLFSYFIEEKFSIFYMQKLDFDLDNPHIKSRMSEDKRKALKHHERVALKAVLPEEIMQGLKIDYQKHMKKILKNYAPIGLVKELEDNVPQFLHDFIAEYLVARYFSRNFKDIPVEVFFEARFNNIRFFFDMLMAENSPAHIAVLYKKFELLKEYDDEMLRRKDLGERSALHVLCSWGQRHPRLTIKHEFDNYIVDDIVSLNRRAERDEYFDAVVHLLGKNDLEERDALLDMTPLSYAKKSESLGAELKLLKVQKAELSQLCTYDRVTILFYSTLLGYDDVCELFTEQNWNNLCNEVNFVVGESGMTLLLLACRKENVRIVKYLITSGARIKQADVNGWTPLHWASAEGLLEVVECLVQSGADIWCITKEGHTALELASFHNHNDVVDYLVKKGSGCNQSQKLIM